MGQKSGSGRCLYKQRRQLSFVESWPLSCECLVTLCHFTIDVVGCVSHINLSTNEGHSWTRSKLYIGDLPWICTPIHVACNHMAVTKNLSYYRYMSQTIGALHPWLQIYNRPDCGRTGNVPAKLIRASCALPVIILRQPWH